MTDSLILILKNRLRTTMTTTTTLAMVMVMAMEEQKMKIHKKYFKEIKFECLAGKHEEFVLNSFSN